MLLPWRITTVRQRDGLSAAIGRFTGYVLIWMGRDQTTTPYQQRLNPQMRQEVVQALHSQTGLDRHIWIASSRHQSTDWFFSLLHAEFDPDTGAQVDLLLSSLVKPEDVRATGYEGDEGEFVLLTMVLERLGVTRLEVPLRLNTDRTGLTYAGWIERTPGVFIWEKPAQAEPSR